MTTPEEIAAVLTRQAQQLDDLEHTVADLRATLAGTAAATEDATPFHYAALPAFVEAVIAPLYAAHSTDAGGWCARWWDHDEAPHPARRLAGLGGPAGSGPADMGSHPVTTDRAPCRRISGGIRAVGVGMLTYGTRPRRPAAARPT